MLDLNYFDIFPGTEISLQKDPKRVFVIKTVLDVEGVVAREKDMAPSPIPGWGEAFISNEDLKTNWVMVG